MSNNNNERNEPTIALSWSAYDILDVLANCYNVDHKTLVETAIKMFFYYELKIDKLKKEGIDREELPRDKIDRGVSKIEQNEDENIVINLKFS
ncbi:MAG: hypothetical protein LBI70_02250 [Rickettsiales bacterium]|jgi:hypothetical protein|nr:hypothetical protein [Rickettsiales bacterium]